MPSLRVLLRIFLILVLCTDGIFGAWATTRMAVNELGRAAQTSASHHRSTRAGGNADTVKLAAQAPSCEKQAGLDPASHHDDCDCGSVSSCTCSCMLTFFPARSVPGFAARHRLASVYPAQPPSPPVSDEISRLFRPPIG